MNKQFNKLILSAFENNKENTKFIKLCIEQQEGSKLDKYFDYIDNIIENIHKQIIQKNRCILFGKKYTGKQTDDLECNLNIYRLFDFINNYYIDENLENLVFCGSNRIYEHFKEEIINAVLKNKRLDIIQRLDKNRLKLFFSEDFYLDDNYLEEFSIDECHILLQSLSQKGLKLNNFFLYTKNVFMAIILNYQKDYEEYIQELNDDSIFTYDNDIKRGLISLIESNKISVELLQNNINILDYYLEKNDKAKIKMFSKELFDRYIIHIVNKNYELLIQMANEDKNFLKKLLTSERILDYYLEQNDRDAIKQFETNAFSSELINKYPEIIYEVFKDDSDFFSEVLADKNSILKCCLSKGEYDYIIGFETMAFREDLIKENIDEIFKRVSFEWVAETIFFSSEALLYCLKNGKYDYIKAFSLEAFKCEEINDYISIIYEKFKNDRLFFSKILAHSPKALLYCLEQGEINNLKNFCSLAFTNDILEKYIGVIFKQAKLNPNTLLLQLSDSDIFLEYCFKKEDYELVQSFSKKAFTEKIVKEYTKIIVDLFKDNEKFLMTFSDNIIILKFCLENNEYNGYLKKFTNSTVFDLLINSDDENKTKKYFVKLLGIKDDKAEEMLNYILDSFNSMISKNDHISFTDIVQYGFNSSKYQNWKQKLSFIIKPNSDVNSFINITKFLLKHYYGNDGDKKKNLNYFFEIIENYGRYKTLLNKMLTKKVLTDEEKGKIKYLFNLDENIKIENIEDVENQLTILKNSITDLSSIGRIKYVLGTLLFGNGSLETILTKINTENLKILKLNNRNNTEVVYIIEQLLIYTSIMEEIYNCNDRKALKEMLDRCEIKECLEVFSILSKLPELERKLYEIESEKNLTKIEELPNDLIQKKDGISYIDLRDKQYILYAHVKSPRESISEICNGTTNNGQHNFISFTPISHRNQNYYICISNKIIFAYDNICKGSFIFSSDINISSNGLINKGSMDLKSNELRHQKGILETSEARFSSNAEALFFREGLKPCGIIIPANRSPLEPTNEELEIAKKYNLSIIYTQKTMETIQNPKPLNFDKSKVNVDYKEKLEYLTKMKSTLLNKLPKKEKRKQYGIITDIHAMYEPALACLEDMRKRGITEIYSLGDNIGLGPNPKEVLELLKEYNVKSIKGNHEIYVKASQDGKTIKDILPKHIEAHHPKNQIVADWTSKQIDDIEDYPISIELTSSSGQKVTLIHSIDKTIYNEDIPDLSDSDLIIQGHKHFENKNGNIITLRAAGMGDKGSTLASYNILKEDDEGNFTIEKIEVPFDRENLLHNVNETLIPDKTDINTFLGRKR